MKTSADIVIIGGGISGASIGYFLLKNGAKNVVILERDYLTAGSTGRCGAGIRQQWGSDINCILTQFSCNFFENAQEELAYPGGIEFTQGGYLFLVTTEKELAQTKKNIALQNSLGINSKLLTPAEAKELAPIIDTSNLLAAAYHSKDGHLSPFKTTHAFAEAFKRLGGEIYTDTTVTGIKTNQNPINGTNRVIGIETTNGNIATENIVIAAGGHTGNIAKLAGVDLPLNPVRRNILVTEPVDPILSTMVMSMSLNFYCQQVPHGSFLMGRACDNQPTDLRVTADSNFPETMAQAITVAMPALKNLRMLRQWAGIYNMSPDKHPIYSKAQNLDGLYISAGYSGHGFMLGPATGQCMAELMLGLTPTLPWERLGLSRFDAGNESQLVHEPSVV